MHLGLDCALIFLMPTTMAPKWGLCGFTSDRTMLWVSELGYPRSCVCALSQLQRQKYETSMNKGSTRFFLISDEIWTYLNKRKKKIEEAERSSVLAWPYQWVHEYGSKSVIWTSPLGVLFHLKKLSPSSPFSRDLLTYPYEIDKILKISLFLLLPIQDRLMTQTLTLAPETRSRSYRYVGEKECLNVEEKWTRWLWLRRRSPRSLYSDRSLSFELWAPI